MMYEAIKNFNKQFEYNPVIENEDKLAQHNKFIVVGMGGSHLAAGLLKIWKPGLDLIIHRDYGLPAVSAEELKKSLIILSSYSGNTEEVISAFESAREKDLSMAVISIGGKLIELAVENGAPFAQMPDTGIQPRSALGYSLQALLKIIGERDAFEQAGKLSDTLNPSEYEEQGKALAEKLKGKAPIIYSSNKNMQIAYNWKIKFNETGKIPAFFNVFPELNHNEMTSFDVKDSSRQLSSKFHFIILKDKNDHPRIIKRMEVLERLYRDRGLRVEAIELGEQTIFFNIFSSLILADWAAYYTAKLYGLEPEKVAVIEEFKRSIE
jgi:glucose/mannose-6-phosphate isomerase